MKGTSKRILALVLTVFTLFSVYIPATAATSGGFSYEVISGSTSVKITGYSGGNTEIVIPDIIDGRTVVEISSGAFSLNNTVKSVSISSNVIRIMKDAFLNCTSLSSVVIPASVSSVGDSAFAGCVSLKDVTISSASTAIGYYAFEGCTALKSITIPSTKIGYAAFRNCTALATIKLLDSVQSVGRYAFDSTAWQKSQSEGLQIIGNVVYQYNAEDKDVVIPEGIKCIADYAFYGTGVKTVVIPAGLYYIGNYAFADCKSMKYISVPSSVISIGTKAIGYVSNKTVTDFIVYCYGSSTAESWAKNNSLTVQKIDNCKHSYSDWKITTEPLCEAEGAHERRCIKCNISETGKVDAKGHTWSGWVTISTLSCTTDGVKRKTCTVCGKTEDNLTSTKGHEWGDWVVVKKADCVNKGERTHTCSVCKTVEKEAIKAKGHKWIVDDKTDSEGWIVTKEPICDVKGTKTRTCSVCKAKGTADIPEKGHVSDEWTILKDPTSITTGLKEGICTVCEKLFTEEIPVIAEELPDDVKTLTLVKNAKIKFNDNRTCINGVKAGTTVNDVLLQFEYPSHLIATDKDATPLKGDDLIGSGCFIFLVRKNEETGKNDPVDTTCVVIKGDLNGDGKVTASDAREALRAAAKLTTLLSPYFLAGDLNGDENINASEARSILRVASRIDTF